MAETILVVEDEPAIRELIGFACESSGYTVLRAGSVKEARTLLESQKVHLILLDWMLPDLSGLQWLDNLKHDERLSGIPVIMLTARGTESDKVAGLDCGADDYVVKPFSPRELIARMRAVLRRGSNEAEKNVVCGPLVMNEARFSAKVNGQELKLGLIEFKMLLVLASNPGRVYSRSQLLERVWDDGGSFDERTIDVHILRLRKQLAGSDAADMVETVRGIGYRAAVLPSAA
ncbi:MAG: response regulator [Sutterellaceae bacterium]|nr:response regulator [Sutterellaceae bacterium]